MHQQTKDQRHSTEIIQSAGGNTGMFFSKKPKPPGNFPSYVLCDALVGFLLVLGIDLKNVSVSSGKGRKGTSPVFFHSYKNSYLVFSFHKF